MKPVWITGAHGLIGSHLMQTASQFAPHYTVHGLTRDQLDLLDFPSVQRRFREDRPQLIIHCAAVTVVADAQKDPTYTHRMNVEVTRVLAELASDIPFIFFSTDLVFDGRRGNYSETDAPNPLQIYGETKLAAEKVVQENPRHLVVRTSLNGGVSRTGQRAFNEQMRHALQTTGPGMKLFTDEFRCPIPAVETARAVWDLAQKNCNGLVHLAGAKRLSRWEIGRLIARRWPDLDTKIEPGLAAGSPGLPRALDTSLNISKIQTILSHPLPALDDWLAANPREIF